MGNIKQKSGQCIDCVPGGPDRPLMAKRCTGAPFYHYTTHKQNEAIARQKIKVKNKSITLRTSSNGLTLGKWFNEQINIMPKDCENCGDYLNPYLGWTARAYVAHIVPKRFFKSVMCHPNNRVFLCIDCHTNFDNGLSSEAVKMKMWPIAVSRFKTFAGEIDFDEVKHLRPCLEDVYNGLTLRPSFK